MIQFILIAILVIVLIIVGLNLFTNLKKSDKIKIVAGFGVFVIIATIFEVSQKSNHDVALRFEQGKTLKCKEIDVNSSEFNFVSGTLTFIGKKEQNRGLMFELKDCK